MSDKPIPPPGMEGFPPPPPAPLSPARSSFPQPPPGMPPPPAMPAPPPGMPPPPPLAAAPMSPLPPPPGLPPPPPFGGRPLVSSPLPSPVSAPPPVPAPPPPMAALSSVPAAPAAPEPASGAAPQTALRKMDAVVVDCVRRTANTVSLYLFVGDPGPYRAGQFVSIDPHQFPELQHWVAFLEEQKGKKELPRAYSLQSAPGEKCLSICVEAEGYDPQLRKYPPLLSPFLAASAFKGRELSLSGYSGVYVIPEDLDQHTDEVLHVVSGAGVVPSYSILKDELKNAKHPRVRHAVLMVHKTLADIVLHEQLNALAQAFPDRLQVVHLISDEDPGARGAGYLRGRLGAELVRKYLRDPTHARVYLSGSSISRAQRQRAQELGVEPAPRFVETALAALEEAGVPRAHIKREEFG